jgi:hypothetical protein
VNFHAKNGTHIQENIIAGLAALHLYFFIHAMPVTTVMSYSTFHIKIESSMMAA